MAVVRPQDRQVHDLRVRPLPAYQPRAKDSPRTAIKSAWRYSIFVGIMKGALPAAAFGLGVAVLAYVMQPRESNRVTLTFEQVGQVENDLAMVKPQLTGIGDNGSPFKVTAATAVQDGRGSDIVRLEQVVADIGLKDGTVLHVTAAQGVADTKRYQLNVSGGIHLTSEEGYDARTVSASADLKAGTIHGETPIVAEGKFGRVSARRFALNQATGELRFSGNVRMLLGGMTQSP